jgi:PIN domain nuclease of toxin-antitoxin system
MTWMLDTHALIWALFEPKKLGRKTREVLGDPTNEVLVSPISYWEISLKHGLGKLHLPGTDPSEIPDAAIALGLQEMPLRSDVLASYHQLPRAPEHRDPFDRMLIWQCIRGKHTLLSKDAALPFYREHGLAFAW